MEKFIFSVNRTLASNNGLPVGSCSFGILDTMSPLNRMSENSNPLYINCDGDTIESLYVTPDITYEQLNTLVSVFAYGKLYPDAPEDTFRYNRSIADEPMAQAILDVFKLGQQNPAQTPTAVKMAMGVVYG